MREIIICQTYTGRGHFNRLWDSKGRLVKVSGVLCTGRYNWRAALKEARSCRALGYSVRCLYGTMA